MPPRLTRPSTTKRSTLWPRSRRTAAEAGAGAAGRRGEAILDEAPTAPLGGHRRVICRLFAGGGGVGRPPPPARPPFSSRGGAATQKTSPAGAGARPPPPPPRRTNARAAPRGAPPR